MRIGTRSLLIGVHQLLVHPIFVWRAWCVAYRRSPTWREMVCILFHDVGYWECNDLDGREGARHPTTGAKIVGHLLGHRYSDLVLLHSRTTAAELNRSCSALCLPDKVSLFFCPAPLYTALLFLGGEYSEYRQTCRLNDLPLPLYIHFFRARVFDWLTSTDDVEPAAKALMLEKLRASYLRSIAKLRRANQMSTHRFDLQTRD